MYSTILLAGLLSFSSVNAADKAPAKEDPFIVWMREKMLQVRMLVRTAVPFVDEVDVGLVEADAFLMVGELTGWSGRREIAIQAFIQAGNVRYELLLKNAKNKRVRHHYGAGLRQLANHFKQDDPIVARLRIRAFEVMDDLCAEDPENTDYSYELTLLLNTLASGYETLGNFEKAREFYQRATERGRALLVRFPGKGSYLIACSYALTGQTATLDLDREREKALDLHREALKYRQKLVDSYPNNPECKTLLAGSFCNIGNVTLDGLKNGKEAIEWFAKALAILEKLPLEKPYDVQARDFIVSTYWGRYLAYLRMKKLSDAERDWERIPTYASEPRLLELRVARAFHLAFEGYFEESLAASKGLSEATAKNPNLTFHLIGAYALIGAGFTGKDAKKTAAARDQALAQLRCAKDLGLLKVDAVRNALKTDRMFAFLRDDKEFQQLLRDSEPLPK